MHSAPDSNDFIPRVTAPYGAGLADLALAVGGLAIGTGEFASMSILPIVANDLHTSLPDMGHMISAYALGVVIGAPLLTIFFARMPRRLLLVGLMLMFSLGNLMAALSTSYGMLIAARFLAGIPHGAYFGVAALVAASMAEPEKRGQAVSRVMLGLTVANIIGVPMATWLGQGLGWRSAFVAVGAIGLLTMLLVAIGFGGLFAVYTYITPILLEVTKVSPWVISVLLALIGVGMTIGNVVGGWLADRSRLWTIFGMLIWNAVVLVAFSFTCVNVWAVAVNMFALGAGIAVVPAVQTRLMDVAGDAQTVAAALNHSSFNIANAIGAWAGGTAISMGLGLRSTGWVGSLLALSGIVVLGISVAVEQRDLKQAGATRARSARVA